MPSMSEDALFKALLKNKPQQKTDQKTESPARNVPGAQAASSEDSFYKAISKNRQQQSAPQVQRAPVHTETMPAAPADYKEPAVEITASPAPAPEQIDQVAESIKNLNASVNLVYGLLKTAVIVMVLILIVGLANLIRGSI